MSTETQEKIDILFTNFNKFLKVKNIKYGDAALAPLKIFSKTSTEDQICNRLDDKLKRIKNGEELSKNDVYDTFGYIALLMIKNEWLTFEEMLD